jgi:hypothetical protein
MASSLASSLPNLTYGMSLASAKDCTAWDQVAAADTAIRALIILADVICGGMRNITRL